MNDIRDFFKALMDGKLDDLFSEDDDKHNVPVGEIPKELLNRYVRHMKDKQYLDEEIKLFIKQEQLKVKRLMEEMYDNKLEQMSDLKKGLWDEISDVVGASRDEELSLNKKTGVVSKKVSKGDKKPSSHLSVVVPFPTGKE